MDPSVSRRPNADHFLVYRRHMVRGKPALALWGGITWRDPEGPPLSPPPLGSPPTSFLTPPPWIFWHLLPQLHGAVSSGAAVNYAPQARAVISSRGGVSHPRPLPSFGAVNPALSGRRARLGVASVPGAREGREKGLGGSR